VSEPFFHVGILVAKMDEAIANFSRVLGIEFNEPSVMRTPICWRGSRLDTDVHVTYSRSGPPYVELIEGHASGYFSLAGGEGIHHIGLWIPPGETAKSSSRLNTLDVEVSMPHEQTTGTVSAMSSPRALHGVRVEMIEDADRAGLEAWISGATQRSFRDFV
jgi:Glyoxalase/Bleomycin resistance protein/Dioxygenase superfamily